MSPGLKGANFLPGLAIAGLLEILVDSVCVRYKGRETHVFFGEGLKYIY